MTPEEEAERQKKFERILDLEMAFAVQHHENYRCGNLYDIVTECCRFKNHKLPHAAGHGDKRKKWWR